MAVDPRQCSLTRLLDLSPDEIRLLLDPAVDRQAAKRAGTGMLRLTAVSGPRHLHIIPMG